MIVVHSGQQSIVGCAVKDQIVQILRYLHAFRGAFTNAGKASGRAGGVMEEVPQIGGLQRRIQIQLQKAVQVHGYFFVHQGGISHGVFHDGILLVDFDFCK